MADKINWRDLVLYDADDQECSFDRRRPEFIRAMRKFRDTDAILGFRFSPGWGDHEDPEDCSTWGPRRENVDFSGLDEELAALS